MNEQMDKAQVQLQEEVKKMASLQAKVTEGEVCLFETLWNIKHWTPLKSAVRKKKKVKVMSSQDESTRCMTENFA